MNIYAVSDLATLRIKRGWSQKELGEISGISNSTVSDLESGNSQGTVESWMRLEDALGVKFDLPSGLKSSFGRPLKLSVQAQAPMFETGRPLKKWTFEPGKKYKIDKESLVFLRTEGIHHIFKSTVKGVKWLTTWTDAQLVGKVVM